MVGTQLTLMETNCKSKTYRYPYLLILCAVKSHLLHNVLFHITNWEACKERDQMTNGIQAKELQGEYAFFFCMYMYMVHTSYCKYTLLPNNGKFGC